MKANNHYMTLFCTSLSEKKQRNIKNPGKMGGNGMGFAQLEVNQPQENYTRGGMEVSLWM